jgi:hypothetical protein
MLKSLVNPNDKNSFSNELRRKRFNLFLQLVEDLPKPYSILDVGGTEIFWKNMNFAVEGQSASDARITLLNIDKIEATLPNFKSVTADARQMDRFGDKEFDVVFSNSVIEHVGNFGDQKRMADEIRRVSKRYYVQTPNYYFIMEPHFLLPGFQFLPKGIRANLINKYDLGNTKRIPDRQEAIDYIESLQLLTYNKMSKLFPDAQIHREKFFGMTKSLISIKK